MAPKLWNPPGGVDVQVLVLVQQCSNAVWVFGGIAEVNRDEGALGVLGDSALQTEKQRFPWRCLSIERQLRMSGELLVSLVLGDRRQPECDRRSSLYRDRH